MTHQFELIIQFATLASLVVGIVFAITELHRQRRERMERAAMEVFRIGLQDSLSQALLQVLSLPQDGSADHVRQSPRTVRDTHLLMLLYEYWGVLVFQRMVPLRTLDLLVGGSVRASWSRLRLYIESERETLGFPALAEWFQWLAERLEQYPQPEKALGANVAFAEWKP